MKLSYSKVVFSLAIKLLSNFGKISSINYNNFHGKKSKKGYVIIEPVASELQIRRFNAHLAKK